MTVGELIELLQDQDPEARVLTITQPSWPFEHEIAGIAVREGVIRAEREENGNDEDDDNGEYDHYERGTAPTDVLIVEGKQLRYGSKSAWDVVG